jgi:dihydroorotase
MAKRTILKGGRVIDPAQGFDRVVDVELRDGKIAAVSSQLEAGSDAEIIDVAGCIVTPGLIDIHVHAYGSLGFAYPDRIGIHQGVTTFVEAGGPGVGTFGEFKALMEGATVTDLYTGVYLRPMGIVGVDYVEGNVESIGEIDIRDWLELIANNRDLVKYLKIGAFGNYGAGPLILAKGVAEIVGLPTYTHIGDFQVAPERITTSRVFELAEAGDIVTHIYHNNPGNIFGDDGRILPAVIDARRRGVLFDIGFGAVNFSFDVAERAVDQDIIPDIISSDLQQFNVLGPVHSLTHVMSAFLPLGLPVKDIIERVTLAPAKALSLADTKGSLAPGRPADVTVLELRDGDFEIKDCCGQSRTAKSRFAPIMAFRDGVRYDSDPTLCEDESNWLPQICEDALPETATSLDDAQRRFLRELSSRLAALDWHQGKVDIEEASRIQTAFRGAVDACPIPLARALRAVYDSFLEKPFTCQIGLFINRLNKPFVLERLNAVAAGAGG